MEKFDGTLWIYLKILLKIKVKNLQDVDSKRNLKNFL